MLIRSMVLAISIVLSNAALAGTNNAVFFTVPTLDEVGIGALVALVGGVAGWAIRRRSLK